MSDDEPISGLELWQFSLSYKDLPFREDTSEYVDNRIYRSHRSSLIFVYHEPNRWDCFVPR